jgi:hypothetical protein
VPRTEEENQVNTHIATRMIERTTAFARYLTMLRQFNAVSAAIKTFDPVERRKIAMVAMKELTEITTQTPEKTARDYSVEAAVAFARLRSQHAQVRAAGVKRWLVCAYRATFESQYGELQTLHRAVLRSLRTMHGENLQHSNPFLWSKAQ